jgi:alpha-D-xyloside xylohydrolase
MLFACSDARIELARAPFDVGQGRHRIAVKDDGRTLAFVRDGRDLVTLDATAFVVGVTAERDASRSWDPVEIERRGESDSGIEYRTPRAFAAIEDARAVDLDFGDGITARVEIVPAAASRFAFAFTTSNAKDGPFVVLTRVRVRTGGDPHEGFYGLGEQEDSVDNRGKLRAMQIEPDGEIESANNEAHVPVPLVIGTRGWAMFVASTRVGMFDVARKDPSVVEATFAEPALRFDLFAADEALDLVGQYTSFAGRPRLPPPWTLGPLLWRDENRDQAEVEADVAKIRELDLATSGIWIDRPYASAVNTFDFDPARYPDPAAMIARVHAAGLRVALWHTPYLEDATGPLAATAKEKHFFPLEGGVPLNKWSAPIDFTNPEARAFWLENVRRYTALGIEGFKLDYAEDIVPSLGAKRNVWRFADGSDDRTMHHRYSALYHDVYAESVPSRDAFLLCRAAHWGEQTNGCIIWPGDMDASLTRHREPIDGVVGVGGLPATIAMGLSLSASGFPFFGSDTGGYRHSPPDDETFIRWFEQTALSTVMQVGDSSSEPPWTRSASVLDLYRRYARLHLRLFPYEWTYAQRMVAGGRPIQRPIGLAHPDLGVHPSDEYLFGEELLVAPVVERGAVRRKLVAPKGRWFDFRRGTAHDGPEIEVDAPLDVLPLFLREGAIVPLLRPTIDTFAPATNDGIDSFTNDAGVLHVLFAPGPAHRFEVYDGTVIERDGNDIHLVPGSVFTKGFALELIATPRPSAVRIDGGIVPFGWSEERSGTLVVTVPAREARVTIR